MTAATLLAEITSRFAPITGDAAEVAAATAVRQRVAETYAEHAAEEVEFNADAAPRVQAFTDTILWQQTDADWWINREQVLDYVARKIMGRALRLDWRPFTQPSATSW